MPAISNNATPNRPEGARLLDAPALPVDLDSFLVQLKNESTWRERDRNSITLFKTPGLTLVISALHKGAVLDNLPEDGVMIVQVLEGGVLAESGKDRFELGEKQMLALHGDAGQRITAVEQAVLLLTVTREDNVF